MRSCGPQPVILVLFIQYVVCPILAALTARIAGVPLGIAAGLVLMSSVPSGAFTNVFTYLGHGNLTLSIVMTCAFTAICFVTTPLALDWLTAAELPADFHIPFDKTIFPVLVFLLLPLMGGMLIGQLWNRRKHVFAKWAVRASLVPLTLIVVGSLGSGRIDLTEFGWTIPILLVVFVFGTLILTRGLTTLVGYKSSDAFTMAIEVAVRNGNLAIALVASIFPATAQEDPVGRGVFFVTLFYSGAMMVIGLLTVVQRRTLLAWAQSQAEAPTD